MKSYFLRYALLVVLTTLLLPSLSAQVPPNWEALKSVENICRIYPDRMEALFQAIDLDRDGLAPVKRAYDQGNLVQACRELLRYYRSGQTADFLRRDLPSISSKTISAADSIGQGIFTFYNQTDQVPQQADGRLNWAYDGPADDIEWAWGLNRHPFLGTLLEAYLETGNPRYAQTIDRFVKDWVISSLPYPAVKSSTAMWRGLEVSFRVKRWAEAFYGLIDSDHLSPATRLLLLSSIPEHAHYLRQFHAQGNWLTMELSALARAATAWPEFKPASEWLAYSKEMMTASLLEQVYPDGVQTELTAHYHRVALSNFDFFLKIFQQAEESLPDVYVQKIGDMWNYLAYSLRPSGTNPLNNDSDLRNYQEMIARVAREYDRPDWLFIATNGREGTAPEKASVLFPYAGQAILRNNWTEQAHWAFFDIGPWGSGHQHNDKLHLSVSAYGQDLLVDAGRFAYRGVLAEKFRPYARSSAGHNLMLIDRQGQAPGPKETAEALGEIHFKSTDHFDYAWGSFNQFQALEGTAEHTRSLTYLKDKFWIVVDRLRTDRPREVQVLWHWHPDCEVELQEKNKVSSKNQLGNLAIVPIGEQDWDLSFVKGQEEPQPQAWYSVEYNQATPNTASIYTTQADDKEAFVWLLLPSAGRSPMVRSRILYRLDDGVRVRVWTTEGRWDLFLPFADSAQVDIQFTPKFKRS